MENTSNTSSAIAGEVKCIISKPATLGEGCVWVPPVQKLYWVDINGKKFHIYDPETEKDTEYDINEYIGACAPTKDGKVLLALRTTLEIFNPEDQSRELLTTFEPVEKNNRSNDGKPDRKGRYWLGTMNLEKDPKEEKLGAFYRIDHDGKVTKILDKKGIPNGLDWTLDNKTFYHTETSESLITAYNFDAEKGEISEPRDAIKFKEEWGHPDGSTLDSEGKLWVACFGGSGVRRFDPTTGELLEYVKVPVKDITCVCFGGKDLKTLFITTSRHKLSDKEKEENPLAGCVFAVETKVKGCETGYFGKQ